MAKCKRYSDLGIAKTLMNHLSNKFSDDNTIAVDVLVWNEFIEKCEEYLNNIYNYGGDSPSEYKIAGAFTFWIRKLKPFYFAKRTKDNTYLSINEYFAVLYGYIYLYKYKT